MRYLGALIGATIGGLIGAAVWAAIAYATNFEIGYIAWGIGVAAGFGAAVGAKGGTDVVTGGIAALAAVAGIGLGKFGAVHFAVDKYMNSPAAQADFAVTDEDMIMTYADTVVEEWEAAGKSITWPPNVDPALATTEAEYPKPVWAEAKKRWGALDVNAQDAAKQEQVAYRREMSEFMRATIKTQAFKDSFGAFDILWVVLALGSAFAIGRGGGDGDD